MDSSALSEQLLHRPATAEDLDVVYDFYMNEASNPYLTYDPMVKSDFKQIFEEVLTGNTMFVVESDGMVVATYRLIPKSDRQAHTVYLGGFAVAHSMKGKGIGYSVLKRITELALSRGWSRIELTVDINNDPAISLYKKVGFEIEGRLRNSYRRGDTQRFYDEYLMGLLLATSD